MSITSSLFIFSLYLSVLACSARGLGVVDDGGFHWQLSFPNKVADKGKPNMNAVEKGAKNGDRVGDREQNAATITTTPKPKEAKAHQKEMKYAQKAISGKNKLVESPPQVGLLKATKIEEHSKWQARSALELGSYYKEEEEEEEEETDFYFTGNKIGKKDTQQNDYEPPHRKSPIHNK